jgi:hypothetical protein
MAVVAGLVAELADVHLKSSEGLPVEPQDLAIETVDERFHSGLQRLSHGIGHLRPPTRPDRPGAVVRIAPS